MMVKPSQQYAKWAQGDDLNQAAVTTSKARLPSATDIPWERTATLSLKGVIRAIFVLGL
jgi:hypothetical protein